jgi:WhiB family redox-sensing transcriptional regulator
MTGGWAEGALCREVGIEVFYPPEETGTDYRGARKVCRACPVQADCLSYVMDREGSADRHNRHGMWAGLSPRQRYLRHLTERQAAA